MQISQFRRRIVSSGALAYWGAALAGIYYLLQAIIYAHTSASVLDEGAYLYKGLLFVTGRYWPYQEYGPWTNHMPLSFLIPGATQVLFAPGLRSGRYFVIFLGLLLLLGVWILARRFGGKWWAAAAVAAVALNPSMVNAYSIAVSQILIACMLVWTLVLTLADHRPAWQLALGAALAGLALTTRENLLPLFPLLSLYIFWQHGLRAGVWAALAGTLTIGIIHAVFWSGILSVWASWIPTDLLDPWRIQGGGTAIWDPNISLEPRIYSFAQGLRSNFIPLLGVFGFGALVFFRRYWKSIPNWRAAIFLCALFGVFIVTHAWASLWQNYCVFCFSGYLMFFSTVGIFFIVIINQSVSVERAPLYSGFSVLIVILASTLVGYGSYQEIGPGLLELPLPRLSGGKIQDGSAPLFAYFENLLHKTYPEAERLVAALAGFLFAVILILVLLLLLPRLKAGKGSKQNLGLFAINVFLLTGLILSPTPLLSPASELERCKGDVIAAYEQVGEYLRREVPPGSRVFWEGGLSVVPMLYLPGVDLYLPQINDGYSYRLGGDGEQLLRYGLWNDELREKWRAEADFILIEERRYNPEWKNFLETGEFQELERSVQISQCEQKTGIRIFRRSR